jgi:hypothetical protein
MQRGEAPPATDAQLWTNLALMYALTPKFDIISSGQVRLGDNMSKLDIQIFILGGQYHPWRWLTLGTGYLQIYGDPEVSGLRNENRWFTEATLQHEFLGFGIADRVRAELRWIQFPGQFNFEQLYRNRLAIDRPMTILERRITSFFRWEEFYDTLVNAWDQRRLYFGIATPVTKEASLELFYVRVDYSHSPLRYRDVFGLTLLFHFDRPRPTIGPPDE